MIEVGELNPDRRDKNGDNVLDVAFDARPDENYMYIRRKLNIKNMHTQTKNLGNRLRAQTFRTNNGYY